MKKILAISLIAFTAVSTANAQIASQAYVDTQDNAVKALITSEATTRENADNAITTKIGTIPTTSQAETIVEYIDEKATAAAGGVSLTTLGLSSTPTEINQLHEAGAVKADFEKLHGISATAAEVNKLAGNAVTAADLTKLSQVTADANELNVLDGITATTAELNYVDGVTSNIQNQLDTKQATANMETSVIASGAGAYDTTSVEKYPSMATAQKIATEAAAAAVTNAGVGTQITNAINNLDTDGAQGAANQVIKTVTQTDGRVSVTSGEVTSAEIADGTIVNNDIASTAAIDMAKIAMPHTIADGTEGKPYGTYSLTANVSDSGIEYKWELISR